MLDVLQADLGRDHRSPVAALGDVLVVAEPLHQRAERGGDAARVPAPLDGRARPAVAGQRRGDDVEGVGGITAVGFGIPQRIDHVQELDDRAGPTVADQQRPRPLDRRGGVDEVDVGSVDLGAEVVPGLQLRLVLPPVVLVPPVLAELLEVSQVGAVVPAGVGDLVRPPGPPEALLQVVEDGVVHGDVERLDVGQRGLPGRRRVRGLAGRPRRSSRPTRCGSRWARAGGPTAGRPHRRRGAPRRARGARTPRWPRRPRR